MLIGTDDFDDGGHSYFPYSRKTSSLASPLFRIANRATLRSSR